MLAVPEKKGGRWDVEEFFAWGVDEIEGLMQYLEALTVVRRERALDFGCGVGRLTQALATYFQRVDAVDIAPSMIRAAEKYDQHPDRCRYHLNDRPDLALFATDSFDLVYSNITLQHMEPRFARAYLVEMLRVLRPGGMLVFQLPSEPERRRPAPRRYTPLARLARSVFRSLKRIPTGAPPRTEDGDARDRQDRSSGDPPREGRVPLGRPA